MSTPRRYRRIPFEIEALQWTEDLGVEKMREFTGEDGFKKVVGPMHDGPVFYQVHAREEDQWINVPYGHYVIKGINGEFYPCSERVFHKTYEPVGDVAEEIKSRLERGLELIRKSRNGKR